MSNSSTRELILAHWQFANDRDWQGFGALLHADLQYEVPQTREYIQGGHGYLEMFRTWPGDWQAVVQGLVCEPGKVACVIDFVVGDEIMTGISIFEIAAGRIIKVTDYWPTPYDPPARQTPHLKRRAP